MIQLPLLGSAMDPQGHNIILLKPVGLAPAVGQVLPIWIGEQVAAYTMIALSGEAAPQPQSHDLMKTLLDTVGAHVERVEVTRIDQGTFYAEITLATTSGTVV